MVDLRDCEHPDCDRPAEQAVQIADMVRAVRCCEEHARDFRACAREGCGRLAQTVVTIGGTGARPADRDQLWLCNACVERFRSAPSLELDGRRFINDRSGWLLPIPRRVGRG